MRSVVGAAMDDDFEAPPPKRRARASRAKGAKDQSRRQARARADAVGALCGLVQGDGAADDVLGRGAGVVLRHRRGDGFVFGRACVGGAAQRGCGLRRRDDAMPDLRCRASRWRAGPRRRQREIARMLGIKIGTPMLYVDVDEARARLEALPWVKSAEVRRVWPDRISVHIVERRPVALWQNEGDVVVVDARRPSDRGRRRRALCRTAACGGQRRGERGRRRCSSLLQRNRT